ncbi:hypothetical protein HOLleu_11882 [Holothuria leucospilota]|uniref:Death domain-containing protein n=1 Tax=Holothuria leucospilota TaxID=206669 RepID=A0A9Q1C9E7_HOLLE|nr:hypothetical protein HOLleu_11882 [Holothuria leucospilota]
MYSFNRTPPEHTKLLLSLASAMTQDDIEKLRMRCGASDISLPPRSMANKSAHTLLNLLDQRRIFRYGDYSRLAEILRDIQREDLVFQFLEKDGRQTTEELALSADVPSDALLQKFANNFGMDWKSFARSQLEILDNEISLIQQSNPHSPVQEHIFQVLKLWRHKKGTCATITALVEKCEAYNLDLETYRCLQDALSS